jgi:Txe/YoeB family toxin of Txe-Axe toxin-antitoxin module
MYENELQSNFKMVSKTDKRVVPKFQGIIKLNQKMCFLFLQWYEKQKIEGANRSKVWFFLNIVRREHPDT